MKFKIVIIILSFVLSFFQSSFNFGVLNLNMPFLFFIYILFFHNPGDALLSIFISGITMDIFSMNFGAYIFSFMLIFWILYYIEKEFLPSGRFFTYIWMNFIGIVLMFLFFAIYNFTIRGLGLGIYYFNFSQYLKMLFLALIYNILFAGILYFLTNIFSSRARNKFISIG